MSELNFRISLETQNPYLKADYEYFGATLEVSAWHRAGWDNGHPPPREIEGIHPYFSLRTKRGEYHDRDRRKFEISFHMDPADTHERTITPDSGLYYPPKPGDYSPWRGAKVRSNSKLAEEVTRDLTLLVHGCVDDTKEPLYRALRAAQLKMWIKQTEHQIWDAPRRLLSAQKGMDNRVLHELQIMDWEKEVRELTNE